MKYFVNFPYTAETLKNEYRELCKKLHPDTGGNAEEFKNMMNEYEQTARNLSGTKQNRKAAEDLAEALRRAAEKMRQEEEARREAERQAEERRRRYEREKEEERKAREAARPAYDARCKKWAHLMEDLAPFAAAVKAASDKERETGRAYGWRSAEYKAAEKATRAARTAENAARRRNLLKMAQTAFKGVKFSLTYDNGWGGGYTVAWTDGPSVQQMQAATDYDLFVSMWDTFDGMTDCADVESAMFTDFAKKYNGNSGKVKFSRSISEANKKKLEEVLISFAPDLGKNDDPDTRRRYGLDREWEDIKVSLDDDKLRDILRIFGADFDKINESGAFRYMHNLSSYTLSQWVKNLAEYLTFKTDDEKKAEKAAQPATFAPRYGAALRLLHKLMGITLGEPEEGKQRVTFWQRVQVGKTPHGAPIREYVNLSILEAVEQLEKGESVYFGNFRDKSEKYSASASGTYNGGYKVQTSRAEKFAAAGYVIKGAGYGSVYDYVCISGISQETAAALRADIADIERQRTAWEKKQQEPQSGKNSKANKPTAETANNDSENAAPADGLELVEIVGGVAVVADDWKTTYRNRHHIKAHGAKWNKDAKQWQATEPADVESLRAWFALRDGEQTTAKDAEPMSEPQQAETVSETETADTLEGAQDITETNESETATDSAKAEQEEPQQEEKRDELKQWHVEELVTGESLKHHLFTDDRNEAAAFVAAKLEELRAAEGVEVLSDKKGRVIWYDGEKYHLLYIWDLDESKSMYFMEKDRKRRRILREVAERHAAAMKRKAEREAQQAAANEEKTARAFAEAFAAAADAMHEAVISEPQSEPTEATQSEPEAVAEEIPTANDESATEPKQEAQTKPEAETAQDGRNCWAFVLLVSGKVARVMACDWWATRSDAERTAEGMQIAAQGFRESAHVAVYQRRTDGRYYFAFGKNLGGRDIFPPVAEIEGGAFVALYDPEPTPTDEAPTEATEAPTEGATVADNDSSTTANDESATEGATAATADTYKDPPRERIRFSPDDYQEAA